MAQWACGSERDENKLLNAITNPHSPEEYRISGGVSNMPEFEHAFMQGGAIDGAGERV